MASVQCSCGEKFNTRMEQKIHSALLAGYHQVLSPEHTLVTTERGKPSYHYKSTSRAI